MPLKNYYAILEVPVGAGIEDIRQAYRRLAQDNLDNEAVFADLKEAHEVLTTPARRAEYDQSAWGKAFGGGGEDAALSGFGGSSAAASRCPMGAEALCPALQAETLPGENYCPDCGFLLAALSGSTGFEAPPQADPAQQIRLEEPGGATHVLIPGLNVVGRESADVLLSDKTVSRQHARLEVSDDGTVSVEDLSSTNGTQVGGEALAPHLSRRLADGERLRFGSVVVVLRQPAALPEASAAPETAEPGMAEPQTTQAQMVETNPEGEARVYPLADGVTTFGRRPDNTVVLTGDPYVSGSHAQILAQGGEFRLTDTGSTNGTLLNGERLTVSEPSSLTDGDVVLFGGTPLRFERLATENIAEAPAEASAEEAAEAPAEPEASENDEDTEIISADEDGQGRMETP